METEPNGEDIAFYPDFLVHRLIQKGIGGIEADRKLQHDGRVDFAYTAHSTGQRELLASMPEDFFHPLLARLGPRFGAEDMLYGGHTRFAVEHNCEGKNRLHRFALYVCNEPAMAI